MLPTGHNLLRQQFIPVQSGTHHVPCTLGDLMARLGGQGAGGAVDGFAGLAAHQRQPWFLFLVQLGALALRDRAADVVSDPAALRLDPGEWARRLAALTPGMADSAWSLLVSDPTRPAFLQPPIGDPVMMAGMKPAGATPDTIDVLITAKNHDVKQSRAAHSGPHHWVYALVSLQTSQGFLGRGNFGIARMNGGFGSRPLIELAPADMGWASRWRRAVRVALGQWLALRDRRQEPWRFDADALALLWLPPWDREEAIDLTRLDPMFLEVCRRLRLHSVNGSIQAFGRPSDTPRVAAKEQKGNLDDPWTPITLKTGGAYTVSGEGFRYDRVVDLLFNRAAYTHPASLLPLPGDGAPGSDGDLVIHLSALARGQGKTEGLHDRVLPLRPVALRRIARGEDLTDTLKLATDMVEEARGALRALKAGLLCLLQGGPAEIDYKDDRAGRDLDGLTGAIDTMFFTHLWARLEGEQGGQDAAVAAQDRWRTALRGLAAAAFHRGSSRLSPPEGRREKAGALAEGAFWGVLNRNVPPPPRDALTPLEDAA